MYICAMHMYVYICTWADSVVSMGPRTSFTNQLQCHGKVYICAMHMYAYICTWADSVVCVCRNFYLCIYVYGGPGSAVLRLSLSLSLYCRTWQRYFSTFLQRKREREREREGERERQRERETLVGTTRQRMMAF